MAHISAPPSGTNAGYPHTVFRTGLYYGSVGGLYTSVTVSQSTLTLLPFFVSATTTFDRIGLSVTAGAASSTVRLGIYNDGGGLPGTLVLDAGTIDSTTTGFKEITISQSLPAGIYYIGGSSQGGAPSTACVRAQNSGDPFSAFGVGTAIGADVFSAGYAQNPVTGALPSPFVNNSADPAFCHHVLLRSA